MNSLLKPWFREMLFALRRTNNLADAGRLIAYTLHFHLANRGFVRDSLRSFRIDISIGDKRREVTFRAGRIGDMFVLYEVLAFGAYRISSTLIEPREVRTIIDCGANIGMTSLYFASTYPAARIYSVEADPDNFAILKENTQSEERIVPIHRCIVTSTEEVVAFNNHGPAWGRKLTGVTAPSNMIKVPAITLDALITKHNIAQVDLLKLDIEGAEREVLAKGDYLSAVQHVIAELHDGYGFSDFSAAVAKYGLRARPPDRECEMVTAHRSRSSLGAMPVG
jgi:FkbM family methyltransferase